VSQDTSTAVEPVLYSHEGGDPPKRKRAPRGTPQLDTASSWKAETRLGKHKGELRDAHPPTLLTRWEVKAARRR
jgi:hypothetical protein